jgi:beta-glucosidase
VPPPDSDSVPDGFIWGTATSAHQVEGGNWNSDWAWEHTAESLCLEPSGEACDHYHLYPQDLDLLAGLGFGAYRFSIEWARIEPEEGEFSRAQLEHYRRVLAGCREHGLAAFVTFHHFTLPRWVARLGGWQEPTTAERFARYCERATQRLGDLMDAGCTINEPNIVARLGYEAGLFPPGLRDPTACARASEVFVEAHLRARDAIGEHTVDVPVGLTLAMSDYQAVGGGEARRDEIRARREDIFLEAARNDDFIGVQTYTRARVGSGGELGIEEGIETTLMGYEFWPDALEATIRRAWEVTRHTPIVVTENGVAAADDDRRVAFVRRALAGVRRVLNDGIDVRGYFYWSALDNFEWTYGYGPTFGLVAVDRSTQERSPKPSAKWLGQVARSGHWPPDQ